MEPISNRDPEFMRQMADMETGWDEVLRPIGGVGLESEAYLPNLRRYPAIVEDGFDDDDY